jgi:hypothetical protein
MTTTQTGTIVVGEIGKLVKVFLDPPPDLPFDLDNATSGGFEFTRPDGTTWSHSLSIPSDILDSDARIVRYVTMNGDLTIHGVYSFKLTINGGPSEILIVNGEFRVEP